MDERKLYPMRFQPIAETVSWGGDALVKKYGKEELAAGIPVGESWELADMGFRDSTVANGWLAGNTIGEVMDMYLDRVSGEHAFAWYGRQFPLLLKFLDIRGRTPLLAHPGDEIASQRYDALGKTKLWYVMEAGKGAHILRGFREEVSAAQLWEACEKGTVEGLLNEITPKQGDWFTFRPGQVHGATGHLVLAEVAESSDLDFKLYNWGRPTENDGSEPLTLETALDFLDLGACAGAADGNALDDKRVQLELAKEEAFTVSRLLLDDVLRIDAAPYDSFAVYQCVHGEAAVQYAEKEGDSPKNVILHTGETVLVPAEVPEYYLVPRAKGTVLLESRTEAREEKDSYTEA